MGAQMTSESKWIPLSEAAERIVAGGRQERKARAEICAAILDLTLQIKARLVADLESRPAPQTVETNEIEIPAVLGPEQIDWLSSRPVRPSRWRVRSQSNSNLWDWREISLIEVSATDLAAALCDDFSSVPLPDSIEQAVLREMTESS